MPSRRRPGIEARAPSRRQMAPAAQDPASVRRRSEGGGTFHAEGNVPQPPGFVVYVEGILRWLGVEGVTPEVLRRAKRGIPEQEVVS